MSASSTPRPPDRHRLGFTLLEVLIAFVILAIASLAIYRGISSGISGTETADSRTVALLHARSKLDEVGAAVPVEPATLRGTFADGLSWTLVIAPFYRPAEADQREGRDENVFPTEAYAVEVTVVDAHGYPLTLTTYRMGPAS